MGKQLVRAGVVTGTALAVAVGVAVPGAASLGDGPTVRFGDVPVEVGTVVATGRYVDGLCHYDASVVSVSGSGESGRTRLTAMSDCQLVVTLIDDVEGVVPGTAGQRPARTVAKRDPRFWLTDGTTSTGGVGGGIGVDIAAADDAAGAVASVARNVNGTKYRGMTTLRFVSAAGLTQWEDQVGFEYVVDKSGDAWNWYDVTAPGADFCGVYDTTDALVTPNATDADDCRKTRPWEGRTFTVIEGWGRYFQQGLGHELYPTEAWEKFLVYDDGYTGECKHSALPPGWSIDCSYSRTKVTS